MNTEDELALVKMRLDDTIFDLKAMRDRIGRIMYELPKAPKEPRPTSQPRTLRQQLDRVLPGTTRGRARQQRKGFYG